MSLISLIVSLILVGLVLYLVQLLPMEATIKKIIVALTIVIVLVWLISNIGVFGPVGAIRIGR